MGITQQFREGVYWQGELVANPLTSTQTFMPQAHLTDLTKRP